MLHQFSWTTFLISFALLCAAWYLGLFLTVYRKEAFSIISGSRHDGASTTPARQEDVCSLSTAREDDLMGKSKLPEGLETVSMSALSFSANESSDSGDKDFKQDQLGLVPDVLEELKEIFAVLAREDGNKNDFFSLVGLITEKYGRIGSNPNISSVNKFILEHAPFAISNEELEDLWD